MGKSERIFITGGAGFVGSYVTRRLLELGHEVCIFDAFIQYFSPPRSLDILNVSKRLEGIENDIAIFRGNTLDLDNLSRALLEANPTRIIHLAAMPLVSLATKRPADATSSIFQGTLNLLQAARNLSCLRRMVYISSSMVYGDFKQIPAPENHPTAPKDVYGGLKLSAEIMCRVFAQQYGMDIAVVRPSAIYGPLDSNRRIISIFLENALAGSPLQVHGADTTLDFTYVTDAAEGIIATTLAPEASMKTFNITLGVGRSALEVAEIIAGLIEGTQIELMPRDETRASRGALDISRAREILGYTPSVTLEAGIARYLSYHTATQDQALRSATGSL